MSISISWSVAFSNTAGFVRMLQYSSLSDVMLYIPTEFGQIESFFSNRNSDTSEIKCAAGTAKSGHPNPRRKGVVGKQVVLRQTDEMEEEMEEDMAQPGD